jgi:hypothetical protein
MVIIITTFITTSPGVLPVDLDGYEGYSAHAFPETIVSQSAGSDKAESRFPRRAVRRARANFGEQARDSRQPPGGRVEFRMGEDRGRWTTPPGPPRRAPGPQRLARKDSYYC